MAFERSTSIQEGDWVIIFQSRQNLSSDTVTPGKEIQSRYGCFRHNDMLGKPWGFKLTSTNGRGFVFLLKPTPELWTLALPHRTQILYLPDIAFITSFLDVKPGSQIIEAGTGSGSFSHSLARTVGPAGKVHSFEYHEERFGKARDEFKQHKLDDVITVKHQNVYKDGFDGLDSVVDSVFLDLPAPWEALGHAKKAMRKDRQARICCFSPCIEQVIRTCSALAELGFSDITMYETLTRTHDPAPLVNPPISSAIERIKHVEVKKERRREGQIEEARRKREEKRKREEEEAGATGEATGDAEGEGEGHEAKKAKTDEGEAGGDEAASLPAAPEPPTTSSSTASPAPPSAPSGIADTPSSSRPGTPSLPQSQQKSGRTLKEDREFVLKAGAYSRGHTSFLTFAVLLPEVADKLEEEGVEGAEAAKVEEVEKKDGQEEEKKGEEDQPVPKTADAVMAVEAVA